MRLYSNYSAETLTDINSKHSPAPGPQTFAFTLTHARYIHLLDSPMAHFLSSHLPLFKCHPSREAVLDYSK